MNTEIDLQLKEILRKSDNVFWGGDNPPFARFCAGTKIFDPNSDYRLSPDAHESFDMVYLAENDLGQIKAWPLVLDESLRLLSPGGVLVIRASDSPFLSIWALKNQLYCWDSLIPLADYRMNDGSWLVVVKNDRKIRRNAKLDSNITFGIITDGNRLNQLDRLIASISELRLMDGQKIELIICGPKSVDSFANNKLLSVRFIEEPENFQSQGWITRKKNFIVNAAKYENIVLVHDRYFFPPDFLELFTSFGFDYDVMTCRQESIDGRRAADWVTLGEQWLWTAPGTLAYGDWNPNLYINGGLIIAKSQVLKKTPWNELLFWMQAEDVELTRRLVSNGQIPRFSRNLLVRTEMLRKGSLEVMESMPKSNFNYWMPTYAGWGNRKIEVPQIAIGTAFDLKTSDIEHPANQGLALDGEWILNPDGTLLSKGARGSISARLKCFPMDNFTLTLHSDSDFSVEKFIVNGEQIGNHKSNNGKLCITCCRDLFKFSAVLRVEIYASSVIKLQRVDIGNVVLPISIEVKRFRNSIEERIIKFLRKSEISRSIYRYCKNNQIIRNMPFAAALHKRLRSYNLTL